MPVLGWSWLMSELVFIIGGLYHSSDGRGSGMGY